MPHTDTALTVSLTYLPCAATMTDNLEGFFLFFNPTKTYAVLGGYKNVSMSIILCMVCKQTH